VISDFGSAVPIGAISKENNNVVAGLEMPKTLAITFRYAAPEVKRIERSNKVFARDESNTTKS
jgi:hypothetical protein